VQRNVLGDRELEARDRGRCRSSGIVDLMPEVEDVARGSRMGEVLPRNADLAPRDFPKIP
jgi:hypothetical protein